MKNIIAISGTHGTSKSCTAYNLASKLKISGVNVAVIDELARECPLKINKDAGELTQYWILASQMKREIELIGRYDYIITDRSIIDTLAYGITLGVISMYSDNFISNYVKSYYKKIFVLDPLIFNYHISDGIRDMDSEFRYNVHVNLVELYLKLGIDFELIVDKNKFDNIDIVR